MINIDGMDKAKVLAALYNNSQQMGMGFMNPAGASQMTEADAQKHIDHLVNNRYPLYFDYLQGRVMKVDLSGDTFNPRLYDRDNGDGAAERAVNSIRT